MALEVFAIKIDSSNLGVRQNFSRMMKKQSLSAASTRKNGVILPGTYVSHHISGIHIGHGLIGVTLNAQSLGDFLPQRIQFLVAKCH